ncbi:MAG: hypothetical protein LBC73_06995 [Oscillospiraceae bacterium]|jgi:hypothetical protein|nr:hypothetical protein [Oscillospiraceae bacterium]
MNQILKDRQATITIEHNAQMKQYDNRLDEFQLKKNEIERCLDDLHGFRIKMKAELEYRKSELLQKGVYEDISMFQEIENALNDDYQKAEYAFMNEQDEIDRERKNILFEKDDVEKEYNLAILALKKEAES